MSNFVFVLFFLVKKWIQKKQLDRIYVWANRTESDQGRILYCTFYYCNKSFDLHQFNIIIQHNSLVQRSCGSFKLAWNIITAFFFILRRNKIAKPQTKLSCWFIYIGFQIAVEICYALYKYCKMLWHVNWQIELNYKKKLCQAYKKVRTLKKKS